MKLTMKKRGLGRGLEMLLLAPQKAATRTMLTWRNNEEIKGLT